jgi:hypothetical protein
MPLHRSLVLASSLVAFAVGGASHVQATLTPAVRAPGPTPTGRTLADTLEALERASWAAWKARDSAFFRRFLSEDHVEVGFFGRGTKAAVLAGVASPACVVTSYEVDQFTVTRFDAHTAALTYHAAQHTLCNGHPVPSPVWATSLYVQRGGHWLNALYQQTPDQRPQ